MFKRLLLVVGMLTGMVGCGGNQTDPGMKISCTITLSGGVSQSYPCTAAVVLDPGSGKFEVGISNRNLPSSNDAGDDLGVAFSASISGEPDAGTYPSTLPGWNMYAVAQAASGERVWVFSNQTGIGTGALSITALSPMIVTTDGTAYAAAGSGAATLKQQSPDGNPEDITMTFNFTISPAGDGSSTPDVSVEPTLQALAHMAGMVPGATPIGRSNLADAVRSPTPNPAISPNPPAVPTATVARPASGQACSITLSGAVAKTLDCTVSMVYTAKDGTTGIEIASVDHIGNIPAASLIVTLNGQPKSAPMTYTWANSAEQVAMDYGGGIQVFTAGSKDGKGSSSLTLTSLNATLTAADGGKVYSAHGSGQATLVGLGGSVQMQISF